MTAETKENMNDFFKQACDTFQNAWTTGFKMQEQAMRMFVEPINGACSFDDARRRAEQFATEAFEVVQKNLSEQHKMLDSHCRTSRELARKALETASFESADNICERTANLCRTTMDSLCSAAELTTRTNMAAFENWTGFFTRNMQTNGKKTGASK